MEATIIYCIFCYIFIGTIIGINYSEQPEKTNSITIIRWIAFMILAPVITPIFLAVVITDKC